MQKRIVGFKFINVSYNAENTAEHILSVVGDYEISNRIITITLDNASVNTRAIRILKSTDNEYILGFLLPQCCIFLKVNIR